MSEVTRFSMQHYQILEISEMTEDDEGDYVLYESYAELKAKYEALLKEKVVICGAG